MSFSKLRSWHILCNVFLEWVGILPRTSDAMVSQKAKAPCLPEIDVNRREDMNKKIIILMAVLAILAIALSACSRSATRQTTGATTPTSEIPFPVATQPQIMVDILKQTQTAAALSLTPSTGGVATPAPTSTPSFAYSTPSSGTAATSAPVVANTPYPTSTPGKPSTWTLQQGEFPYCIARRFDVDPVELLTVNGLTMDSRPYVGTSLTIPSSGSFPGTRALISHPTTYSVLAGETVYQIACKFGDVDPNIILAANGLSAGSVLTAGQVLQIP
jgi:LysM repeat protein